MCRSRRLLLRGSFAEHGLRRKRVFAPALNRVGLVVVDVENFVQLRHLEQLLDASGDAGQFQV